MSKKPKKPYTNALEFMDPADHEVIKLRPGDIIAYNHSSFTAGTLLAKRTATIMQFREHATHPMELSDGYKINVDDFMTLLPQESHKTM